MAGTGPTMAEIRAISLRGKPDADKIGEDFGVAVLPHDVFQPACTKDDFLWFKVKARHSVGRLRQAYIKQKAVTDVEFAYDGVPKIDDAVQVRNLNQFNDNIVVFTTKLRQTQPPRMPLQPIDPQTSTPRKHADQKPMLKSEPQASPSRSPFLNMLPAASTLDRAVMPSPQTVAVKHEPEHQPWFPLEVARPTVPEKAFAPKTEEAEDEMDMDHKEPVPDHGSDNKHWLEQLSNLRNTTVQTPTVIGVVGNTGAGKSSVINALLEEERLVPTNCMRACTAVVTEMSWNDSDDPLKKYRAEIEFIDPKEWEKDLKASLDELTTESGSLARDNGNPDSEASVAWAKVRAVYPLKTKEQLAESSVEQLMKEQAVQNVLGTTQKLEKRDSDVFYRALQYYVDSKEKSKKKKDKNAPAEKKQMEFWPLIKVVRIYVKADALSTGAILVDLPGVHDSNAARAAVAAGYLKQCTGLWVVAPIGRAVDDKAAKNLLGESFKRQLKFDGTYSRVTFICSKTDDISTTEAADTLNLEDRVGDDWARKDEIEEEQATLQQDVKDLLETKSCYLDTINAAENETEVYEELLKSLKDEETVYAPSTKKRKRSPKPEKTRKKKKSKQAEDSDDDSFINDDDEEEEAISSEDEDEDQSDDSDNEPEEEERTPLTEEDIQKVLENMKTQKKNARRERTEIDHKVAAKKAEIASLEKAKKVIEVRVNSICIQARNDYFTTAIQQDFADGVKELDMENAEEENEDNFDPDREIRDYAEVAKSLKVFCVSSRAYQKLSGRMKKDADVPGFPEKDDTMIPQLQAHCKKLTEGGRASNCRRFLTDLNQLLNSLSLWSANDGTGLHMTKSQVDAESRFLKARLQTLDKSLDKTVEECLQDMRDTLAENIFSNFPALVQQVAAEATSTAQRWGDRNNGGFYWSTYKALCRRSGVFQNGTGLHDLNADLAEPIMKSLANNWEKAFGRRLPGVLENFSKKSKSFLYAFHKEVETWCVKNGIGVAGLGMLGQQLRNYEATFTDLVGVMKGFINDIQRDANREFTPAIASKLASAYEFCASEVGPGQLVRMKRHMGEHIEDTRSAMFRESVDAVQTRLVTMCKQVAEEMAAKTEEVWSIMNRDYTQVNSGTQLPEGEQMPKWERNLRAEIANMLREPEKTIEIVKQAIEQARLAEEARLKAVEEARIAAEAERARLLAKAKKAEEERIAMEKKIAEAKKAVEEKIRKEAEEEKAKAEEEKMQREAEEKKALEDSAAEVDNTESALAPIEESTEDSPVKPSETGPGAESTEMDIDRISGTEVGKEANVEKPVDHIETDKMDVDIPQDNEPKANETQVEEPSAHTSETVTPL
ncbi:putative GTPase SLIP-GC [Glarea lozoyensis 74030]|uniref:Putative GTPase SLIP-GC n=1 Tax=Glarea lozoyensis (strain ATCC 74030 / MF5533) TaxID=1104152 RepID=H0ECX9_GLAL7|nr:putative GTPase SLIP-GC [Glarea lozoyensis 74030]